MYEKFLLYLDDDNNHSGDVNFDILRSDCKYITEGQIKDFFCLTDQAFLNFLHINCRSLKTNFGPITNLLNFLSGPLSAITVTETWLSESLQDVFTIQGYNFFSKPRCNRSGGGVGIYVNASFDCKIRLDLCYMNVLNLKILNVFLLSAATLGNRQLSSVLFIDHQILMYPYLIQIYCQF